MKNNLLKFLLVAFITVYVTACSKESDSTTNNGSNNGINGGGTFIWTENDNTFAAANIITCDSAYASLQFKTIFVYKGATATRYFYEINLTGLAVANYPITSSSSANAVSYIKPGSSAIISGFGGNIEITANANSKISGNGVVSVTLAGTASRLYVRFTNLPVR